MNTDTTKRYKLLKDYNTFNLEAKKGDIGILNEEHNVWFDNYRYFFSLSACTTHPEWFEEVLPVSEPVKEGVDKQKIFQSVLKTLKNNKVMVDTREDGIYVRLAGKESLGEAFTLHFGLVYPFYAQPSALNDTVVEDKNIVTPFDVIAKCDATQYWMNKYYDLTAVHKEVIDSITERKYTQSEVDTIREDAFESGYLSCAEYAKKHGTEHLPTKPNLNTNDTGKDQNDKGNYTPPLSEIKEGEDKPVLFTTEDGVDIKIGDDYWVWDFGELNNIHRVNKASRTHTGSGIYRKYFSTKEAAEQYILFNTPCLTLEECKEVMGSYKLWNPIQKLLDKARFKINNK